MASYLSQDLCITVSLSGMPIPLAAESSRREKAVDQQCLPTLIMYWQDFAQAPQQSSFLIHLKSTWRGVPPPLFFFPTCHLSRFHFAQKPWKSPTPIPLRNPQHLLHRTQMASWGRVPGQLLPHPLIPPLPRGYSRYSSSSPALASVSLPAATGVYRAVHTYL